MSSDFDKTVNRSAAGIHLLQLHDSPVMRWLYLSIGITALFMGILGIFLPILPTTPFILLAAGCFARSSGRFHGYLLSHRVAGPIIQEWCQYRSVTRKVKHWAYLVMLLSFGSSILIVPSWGLKSMLVLLAAILFMFIWRLPVRDKQG
ncbi:YbaN family protein [Nitrosomonas sp.]|uniref:YbaN family protein n=1 Tax=Nitrosomonas sp. TaxID=42353 RepID=UPI002600F93A|nr:YbaN family protein [Nitrosomonas sp.]MCC6917484.1 YbaN family protein [Nitrosomonas sp.]